MINAVSTVGYFKIELEAERCLLRAHKTGSGHLALHSMALSRKVALGMWEVGMP